MNPVIALVTSRLGPVLGLMVGRLLPRAPSTWLADRLAAWAAAQPRHWVVRAVRSNQAIVRGLAYDDPSLSEAVLRVFRNAAHGYLTFFRRLARGRASLGSACEVEPTFLEHCRQARESGRGTFFVGPHMGNFDITLIALQQGGVNPLVLSHRNPRGSYAVDNAIRRSYGVELTPISLSSLRQAHRRLNEGGAVLTLVDRPDPSAAPIRFFGQPARLPSGHARLALRSNALILVGASLQQGQDSYRVEAGELIDPGRPPGTTMEDAIREVTQHVAHVMERFIRRRPEEWLMFRPVWPQTIP